MTHLLNPKVSFVTRKFLTEKELSKLLKKLKQKKYGFKDYAVEVEEVTITEEKNFGMRDRRTNHYVDKVCLKPGNYFHVHVEYIV